MSIIKLKRSDTAAVSPTGLAHGEVAVNITDKKIFIGNSTGGTVLLVDGNATGGGGTTSTETIQDAAASLFTTGRDPGCAIHTGQMCVFGKLACGSFLHPQNILLFVLSSTWTSSPITTSYLSRMDASILNA